MSDAPGGPVISVRGLTKRYGGRAVVDHLDLDVQPGRIHGFLGPNGSGKTTTIRMICGLLRPDEGTGTCLGLDILRDAARIKRQVGYMTQRFSLYEDLSIEENLDFVARVYGMRDRAPRVQRSLDELGLAGRRKQLAGSLSGGWKQRLALAACLIHDPRLLLLDEPTAGVDPAARREFWDHIHQLAGAGITVLVSTHYMDEAERCHELAYIAYGRLLARGTVDEVVHGAGLSTVAVTGPDLMPAAQALGQEPGILTVAPFGTALHVSADDPEVLKRVFAQPRFAQLRTEPIEPGLEDVFIRLMQQARDNFAEERVQ